MIVYLWQGGRWTGVSGKLSTAQDAAAQLAGGASDVRVEDARVVYGHDLERVYERLGRTWTFERTPMGAVIWTETRAACAVSRDA